MPNKMVMEVGMTDIFLTVCKLIKKRLQEPQSGRRRPQKIPSLLALSPNT